MTAVQGSAVSFTALASPAHISEYGKTATLVIIDSTMKNAPSRTRRIGAFPEFNGLPALVHGRSQHDHLALPYTGFSADDSHNSLIRRHAQLC
jgi:hypothetical protein